MGRAGATAVASRHLVRCSRSCPCFPRWNLWSWRPSPGCRTLGIGKGLIGAVPAVATVSSQRTAINHVAPAAAIGAAAPIALANGLVGNGLIANGLVGNGLIANGLYGNGVLANGVIAGNGILANGLVTGHGIAGPLAIGNGLLGAPYGLGVGKVGLAAPLGLGLGLGKAIY
ncbi:hypothetical protein CEXT_292841 [Caerostris extrusa]|uniref:Uncharacterized protein n=1 Tax=Caerostris extrusa TaxID=172846 RepID=A0AAV4SIE8_CAEEX|nr:hypothetical protein CEXT_292841 [Caerostris extrusa]